MQVRTIEAQGDGDSMSRMEEVARNNLEYLRTYNDWFRAQGVAIMEKGYVQQALEKLVEEMREDHPDVRLDPELRLDQLHGNVSRGVKWNFQNVRQLEAGFMADGYQEIVVLARVATGEIGILSEDPRFLGKDESQTPGVVEATITEASKKPFEFGRAKCYFKNK